MDLAWDGAGGPVIVEAKSTDLTNAPQWWGGHIEVDVSNESGSTVFLLTPPPLRQDVRLDLFDTYGFKSVVGRENAAYGWQISGYNLARSDGATADGRLLGFGGLFDVAEVASGTSLTLHSVVHLEYRHFEVCVVPKFRFYGWAIASDLLANSLLPLSGDLTVDLDFRTLLSVDVDSIPEDATLWAYPAMCHTFRLGGGGSDPRHRPGR